jgi:hypothetical protein
MFLDFLCKKRISRFKEMENQLFSKIKTLGDKKIQLESENKILSNKLKRIEYLLNDRVHESSKYLVEKTKKEIEVLTSINKKGSFNDIEIEIFDLTCYQHNESRELVLWGQRRDKAIFIQDIQGGHNYGHGELALNHLFKIAKDEGFDKIEGNLSHDDYDHIDRLYAFYEKMGFEIIKDDIDNQRIIKKLA